MTLTPYAALIERLDTQMSRIDEELRLFREARERHATVFDDTRKLILDVTLLLRANTAAVLKALDRLDDR